MGRYFDAAAALGLGRRRAAFPEQLAVAWEGAATDAEATGPFPYAIDRSMVPWQMDLRPTLRAAAEDLRRGVVAATVSARFHQSVIAMTARVVRLAALRTGVRRVVLSGGCFHNALLTQGLLRNLQHGIRVHLHERVPPGAGGVALGQAYVAAWRAGRHPQARRRDDAATQLH